MTQIDNPLSSLSAEAWSLYDSLKETGRRAMMELRRSDPSMVEELVATFESEDGAAGWLISRTIGFGGRSAWDLLANEEREQVMHVLHHLRYGLCA